MQRRAVVFLALMTLPTCAVPAAAQGRLERPYRGLFQSGIQNPDQSLTVNGSAGAGFDTNVIADALYGDDSQPVGHPNSNSSGGVAEGSAGINYALRQDKLSLSGSGMTTLHYYPTLGSKAVHRYYANAAASVDFARYLSANGAVQYAPYNLSSLYPFVSTAAPAQPPLSNIDFASSLEHYFTYTGGLGYSQRLSRKTTIGADYTFQRRDGSAFTTDYFQHEAGGALTYEVGRGLNVRGGYGYTEADYGAPGRKFHSHSIDAGVDYNRALSFSRRTMLSFGTGSSATSNPAIPGNTVFFVTGHAQLTHEMGRTWQASAAYGRDVHFDAAWGDVVMSDGITAGLNGLLSRRVSLGVQARASVGTIGFARTDDYDATYADAYLGYTVQRHISVSVSYAYYRHRFDAGATLPSDFVNQFDRHSVRASVSLWAPLIQRARRTNAAR